MSLKLGLVLLFAMTITIIQAEAVSLGKITISEPKAESNRGYAVGVVLSNTCISLVKQGKDTCPSYRDLQYLDNSNPAYSGKFKDVNGFYSREQPKFKHSMGFYQYDPTFRVFVDPQRPARMPLITIETQIPEYHLDDQFKVNEIKKETLKDSKAQESIRKTSHTRWVDKSCSVAVITAKNWQVVLPDTIEYLRHACDPNHTKIDTIANHTKPIIQHDVATSAKYKLDKFYKQVSKDCTKSFQKCKTVDNRAVTTLGDKR